VPVDPPPEPEPPLLAGVASETDEPPGDEPEVGEDVPLEGAGWLDSGPNSVATCWPEAGVAVEGLSRAAGVASRFAVPACLTEAPELAPSALDAVCTGAASSAVPVSRGALFALGCPAEDGSWRWE